MTRSGYMSVENVVCRGKCPVGATHGFALKKRFTGFQRIPEAFDIDYDERKIFQSLDVVV